MSEEGRYPEAAIQNKPIGYWEQPDRNRTEEEEEKGWNFYAENERGRDTKIRKDQRKQSDRGGRSTTRRDKEDRREEWRAKQEKRREKIPRTSREFWGGDRGKRRWPDRLRTKKKTTMGKRCSDQFHMGNSLHLDEKAGEVARN